MTIFSPSSSDGAARAMELGTKDGRGCADHDQPYTFGRRPKSVAPFPFTARQFARLLALRGRVADGLVGSDDVEASGISARSLLDANASSRPTLFYPCLSCGAMVPGAHQAEPRVLCPRCSHSGERDEVARIVLLTAGVLDDNEDAVKAA